MNKLLKPNWLLLLIALTSSSVASICAANDCKPIDREASITQILKDHSGGKVLKVDERVNDQGCAELEVRILINGTVKAVVVTGSTSA